MTATETRMPHLDLTFLDHDPEQRRANAVRRVTRVVATVRSGATTLAGRAPGVLRATQARASEATSVLQRLPDSTLRLLAAGSLGVAAGFQLAGAPRLVRAVGAAPALFMGAAIALRPTDLGAPAHEHEHGPAGGPGTVTDEHTKGAISKVEGTIEESFGKLTGDQGSELHGKARQVQGSAQEGLGDLQDALRGLESKDRDHA